MTVRSRSIPQRPPSGNLVCLLPLVLTDCTSLCVYCCSADSRIINRTKWTPVFCKPASGEHSVCCCLQLLTSIQETKDSLSSSPTQAKKKKKKRGCLNGMHLIHFKCFLSPILNFPKTFSLYCISM